jgi:hypothetical protein
VPLHHSSTSPNRIVPRSRFFPHTIGGTLRDRALATTTADANAVDDIALLGLVSKTAGLVRARGARGAVNNVQLTVLYYALSAKVQRVYSTDRADGCSKSLFFLFLSIRQDGSHQSSSSPIRDEYLLVRTIRIEAGPEEFVKRLQTDD